MSPHTCKHYNGTTSKCCAAGVKYWDVTSEPDRMFGSAFRKPCIQWDQGRRDPLSPQQAAEYAKRGKCDKFELPTKEEVQAHLAKVNSSIKNFTVARDAILAELNRRHEDIDVGVELIERCHDSRLRNFIVGAGKMECPICGGELRYSRSALNGHIHAACSKPGCVRWME